jgi:hypothetical protein
LLVLSYPDGPRVVAAVGDAFAAAEGSAAPPELTVQTSTRLAATALAGVASTLGIAAPSQGIFIVPFETAETYLGSLALLDPDGDTPDDRLMEAYASRAAGALLHTLRRA